MPRLARAPRRAPGSPLTTLCKTQVLQIFLQYCYSAILSLELHCSNIVKKNIYILLFPSISLSSLSLFMFSSLFSFSLSHLLSPLFKPKHHPPPNINITRHSGGNVDAMIDTSRFHNFFFPCCDAMILANRS